MTDGVSIIVPFHRKPDEFALQVASVNRWNGGGVPVEWVLLNNDDGRTFPLRRFDHDATIKLVEVPTPAIKGWRSPGLLWNLGSRLAKYETLLLSHPDIVHLGDVVGAAVKRTADVTAFACRSLFPLPAETLARGYPAFCAWAADLDDVTFKAEFGLGGWYAHSVHRRTLAPWCLALAQAAFFRVGGFDCRFDPLYGLDDVDFDLRLRRLFGDAVAYVDEPHVGHMGHGRPDGEWMQQRYAESLKVFTEIHGDTVRLNWTGDG